MKPGDKVLICADMTGDTAPYEKTITKVGTETVQCGSNEETYYKFACWPIACKAELEQVLAQRAILKKAYDDSMSLVYELRNKLPCE